MTSPEPREADLAAPTDKPILEPRDGIPPVTETSAGLLDAVRALEAGNGPVAVDAERASGYRYGQRAYLLQFHREGSGTWLIDPVALPDLTEVQRALDDCEWVLHAASQDLPCLRERGLAPRRLFDTEVAGRLLGRERVGLGPLVEAELGAVLEKGHGAADWSTRPLPQSWLRYAALDVEVLLPLRAILREDLATTGKTGWAEEEFEAIRTAPAPAARQDPWRRTSGLHTVRGRRQLAIVRELWNERDDVARQRDLSPGRVLPDSALIAAARAEPSSAQALQDLKEFRGRGAQRHLRRWWLALDRALRLPEADLPPATLPGDGPPPPRLWADRDPPAAARLAAARAVLAGLADDVGMPVENLLPPDAVRRLAWTPPAPIEPESVADRLRTLGAREWQVGLTGRELAVAMAAARPEEGGTPPED